MITTTEAADALGVSGPYLARLLRAGRLPHRKTDGQQLIPLAAVRTFETESQRALHELTKLATSEERLGMR